MQGNYPAPILDPLILQHEGGYVNHPKDPGGATNRGVIQRTYDSYRAGLGKSRRNVKRITDEEVFAIYRSRYWNVVAGDSLPSGIDYATMDGAVNSGPKRGVRWLQRALGPAARPYDGVLGSATMVALQTTSLPHATIVKRMCADRRSFLQGLTNWKTFGKGWGRRVAAVEAKSLKMVAASQNATMKQVKDDFADEARKSDRAVAQNGGGAVATGGGGAAAGTQLPDPTTWLEWAIAAGAGVLLAVVVFGLLRQAWFHIERSRVFKETPT